MQRDTGLDVPTPVVGQGIAVFSAAHPVKRAVAIRLGGSGDVTGTSQVVWGRDKGTGYTPSSILYGDYVYLMTDRGLLTCIDVKMGEVKYEGARVPNTSTALQKRGRIEIRKNTSQAGGA